MFTDIDEYMRLSRIERMKHLDLSESCIEIGGTGSKEYKGLLAHYLRTTIPTKNRMIHLCHACNNHWCSNPKHLYWGTPKDNLQDQLESGRYKSVFQKSVEKHGLEKTLEYVRKQDHSNRTEPSHKLSDDDLEKYREVLSSFDRSKRGWITEAAKRLNVSHTHVRRMAKRIFVKV